MTIKQRLEYLRGEIKKECISYGEIVELQGLKEHIEEGDVELLQWAGVPEFSEEMECLECGKKFVAGEDGNELGLCEHCASVVYDCEKYYKDYDNGRVTFKGTDTISRGILEPYRL